MYLLHDFDLDPNREGHDRVRFCIELRTESDIAHKMISERDDLRHEVINRFFAAAGALETLIRKEYSTWKSPTP